MDFLRSFIVFMVVVSLFIDISLCIPWDQNVGKGDILNSMNAPYLSEAYDSLHGEREGLQKSISKRSTDWSFRQSASSVVSSKLLPEYQESENIEITTKLPKVIRKIRLQNVPHQFKHFDKNDLPTDQSNSTITSDKRGRVVRVKKFRRRTTTANPTDSTTTTRIPTTIRHTTSRPLNFVRQTTSRTSTSPSSAYSHITVINKEFIHQKPNRKNRNKNMNRIWVPTSTLKSRTVQKESNDVTSQPYQTDIKKQRFDNAYDDYQSKNKGLGAYDLIPDSTERSRSNRQITNQDYGSKLETGRLNEPNTRRTEYKKKQKPTHSQVNMKPASATETSREIMGKNSHQTINPNSGSDTTPMPPVPKSVEILTDDHRDQKPLVPHNIPQSNVKTNDSHIGDIPVGVLPSFGSEISSEPQTNSQLGQIIPEAQFSQFPPQRQSMLRGYPYENINPYFRLPQQYIQGIPPIQTSSPLVPTNFRQPFAPFNQQNGPQFQNYFSSPFQPSPYHRREGLSRPDFYQSPQLASLRRAIIEDAYSEEEVTEPTTEFSIPKFEIPSIDFNDKGCRTVYKEVRAIPTDGLQERTPKSDAKSFVMTRECYFPDGVPTVKPLVLPISPDESTENVTSPTKEI